MPIIVHHEPTLMDRLVAIRKAGQYVSHYGKSSEVCQSGDSAASNAAKVMDEIGNLLRAIDAGDTALAHLMVDVLTGVELKVAS